MRATPGAGVEAASFWREKHEERGPGAVTVPSICSRLTWGAAQCLCTSLLTWSPDATYGTTSRLPVVRMGEGRVSGAMSSTVARACHRCRRFVSD